MRAQLKSKLMSLIPIAFIGLGIASIAAIPVLVVGCVFYPIVYGVATGQDLDDADNLARFVRQNFQFQKEPAIEEGHSPIVGNPGSKGILTADQQLVVYCVTDHIQQDKLIELASQYLRAHVHYTTDILFYEKENLIYLQSPERGIIGWKRGREKLLRKIVVK